MDRSGKIFRYVGNTILVLALAVILFWGLTNIVNAFIVSPWDWSDTIFLSVLGLGVGIPLCVAAVMFVYDWTKDYFGIGRQAKSRMRDRTVKPWPAAREATYRADGGETQATVRPSPPVQSQSP